MLDVGCWMLGVGCWVLGVGGKSINHYQRHILSESGIKFVLKGMGKRALELISYSSTESFHRISEPV